MSDELPESDESLFMLAAPPLVWASHFVVSYGTVAIYCAKLARADGSFGPAQAAIGVYTAVGLGAVAWLGARGYRRHGARADASEEPREASSLGRHRFLGLATALLAGLSALAIAYSALVAVLVRSCR